MTPPVLGVAAESGLGTSPPSPVAAGGAADVASRFTFGTGSSPASSTDPSGVTGYFLVRIQFAGSFGGTLGNQVGVLANPVTTITPENGKTAALGPFWAIPATGSNPARGAAVDIWCTNAPAASQGSTTYQLGLACIQGP